MDAIFVLVGYILFASFLARINLIVEVLCIFSVELNEFV
jgi:hypothetical protein